eukprot:7900115-Heterocapsa_arctica.AAC.1
MYVALPAGEGMDGFCGLLEKSMYGAQDASACWEIEYVDMLEKASLARGMSNGALFFLKGPDIRALVHGDDFIVLGEEEDQ